MTIPGLGINIQYQIILSLFFPGCFRKTYDDAVPLLSTT